MSDPAQQAMTDRYNGVFTPLEISAEAFKAAYDTPDIGPHIEKDYKGLSYLSWPFAYRYLKEHFPTFFVAFEEKSLGEVVFGSPGAYYLRPYLTDGIRRTVALIFPIMDRRHNSIKELDGRAISDNCQRAAVKCIATFTGLGLRLYAGEDIPKEEEQGQAKKPAPAAKKDVASPTEATGGTSNGQSTGISNGQSTGISSEKAESFDGKEALVAFCAANPLSMASERACQLAVKEALEGVGLARGNDVKDTGTLGNVLTTVLVNWTKQEGIKITKAAMAKDLAAIREACHNGVDAAITVMKAFCEEKK